MLDKVRLAKNMPEFEEIPYQGSILKVKKFLSKLEMEELSDEYIKLYFDESLDAAEYFLLFAVLDFCTNIQLFDDDERTIPTLNVDDISAHWELILQIRTKIRNFASFYDLLQNKVKNLIIEKNSLNQAIQIGYAKLQELLQTNISEEQIGKIRGLLAEVEASPILNEATKMFRLGYTKETLENTSPAPRKRTRKSK